MNDVVEPVKQSSHVFRYAWNPPVLIVGTEGLNEETKDDSEALNEGLLGIAQLPYDLLPPQFKCTMFIKK